MAAFCQFRTQIMGLEAVFFSDNRDLHQVCSQCWEIVYKEHEEYYVTVYEFICLLGDNVSYR